MSPNSLSFRPDVILRQPDFDALASLVGDLPGRGPVELLQQELDRATVCAAGDFPREAVGLGRWVHYSDGRGGPPRRIRIVLPDQADIDAGRVSILSYVGAGLIGLREGESLDWPDPSGGMRRLTVVRVEDDDPLRQAAD